MIRLKDILKETEEYQQLPSELKKHFLEIISTYGQHREAMNRKSDIRTISETLGAIADAAQEYTLREGGDWFDRVTIKRNMSELKKLQGAFDKEAQEAAAQQQRLESLYEDMGHVLGRYFEIADVSEDVMRQRLGLGSDAKDQQQQVQKAQLSQQQTQPQQVSENSGINSYTFNVHAHYKVSGRNQNEAERTATKFLNKFLKNVELHLHDYDLSENSGCKSCQEQELKQSLQRESTKRKSSNYNANIEKEYDDYAKKLRKQGIKDNDTIDDLRHKFFVNKYPHYFKK